ncbi:hypothetical protein NM208_g12236 [Fusarium decemcellulare]|uniref:Uncharacterized protein n=1 Tax=Fusarium decemcellulare TaxID=57161 RepID=A0ACC1RQT3_9HYPO|nr:hypothetical protein NM208_g12236 [Fusarium decemcellulare]
MLVRDSRRLILFVAPTLLLVIFAIRLYCNQSVFPENVKAWVPPRLSKAFGKGEEPVYANETLSGDVPDAQTTPVSGAIEAAPQEDDQSDDALIPQGADSTHQEVFSVSTKDRKYFPIEFGDGFRALNPNIIPHPILEETWIIVAQWRHDDGEESSPWFTELVCNAAFQDGALRCLQSPMNLPVAATVGGNCEGDLAYFNWNFGPHDARVFFGPEKPYTTYGSNSGFTCFGQWVQDFRTLVDWKGDRGNLSEFRVGTELQRPTQWNPIEKNCSCSGTRVNGDGSVGPDLAPLAEASDQQCLAKYLPKLAPELESIHQTTNSLQITMCRRDDPMCIPDDSNTFIMMIYQHKTFYNYHSVYEPYVILFRRHAPFEIHAMSRQPLWIHGRQRHPDKDTSDMFYVTSMSWRQKGQTYHGHIDDELFLAFGIEDERTAGINLLADDMLKNLGLCMEA